MRKFIGRRWAKAAYVFRREVEAETNLLNAGRALRTAAEKRTLARQLTERADQMDARIKEVYEMEEKGYYVCDEGHEIARQVLLTSYLPSRQTTRVDPVEAVRAE